MDLDKNTLEQLKNLSAYLKQFKEFKLFLQQTPNFYDTVKFCRNFSNNLQEYHQQQIQGLKQFQNFLKTYEKEIKETFSENQINDFKEEYDSISSNPSVKGKEIFISYKIFIIFVCLVLTILDIAPIPYANLIKSLTESFIAKYTDDENMKSYLDKFSEAIINILDDYFINKRK